MADPESGRARPGGRNYNALLNIAMQVKGAAEAGKSIGSISAIMSDVIAGTEKWDKTTAMLSSQINEFGTTYENRLASAEGNVELLRGATDQLMTQMARGREPEDLMKIAQFSIQAEKEIKTLTGRIEQWKKEGRLEEEMERLGLTDKGLERLKDYQREIDNHKEGLSELIEREEKMKVTMENTNKALGMAGELFGVISSKAEGVSQVTGIFSNAFKGASKSVGILKRAIVGKLFPISDKLKESFGKKFNVDLKNIGQQMTKTGGSSQNMAGKLKNAIGSLDKVGGLSKNLTGKLKGVTSGLGKTGGKATKAAGSMTKLGAAVKPAGGAMTKAGASAGKMAGGMGTAAASAGSFHIAVIALRIAFETLKVGLQLNMEAMEKFRTTGYRSMGSIREVTDASFELRDELGLTAEESYKVIEAMRDSGHAVRDAGVSMEEHRASLSRSAKDIGAFAKATGASEEATAKFTNRLDELNISANDQTIILGNMAVATKKYGFSASNLNEILGHLKETSIMMEVTWRDTKMDEYAEHVTALAGAAKQLGIDVSEATRMMEDVASGTDEMMVFAAMGGDLEAMLGGKLTEATRAAEDGMLDFNKQLEESGVKGAMAERMLRQMGTSSKRIAMIERARKKERGELTDPEKAEEAKLAMMEAYATSMKTLTQTLQKIVGMILAPIAKAIGPLADILINLMGEVGPSFGVMGEILGELSAFVGEVIAMFAGGILKDAFGLLREIMMAIWDIVKPLLPVLKFMFKSFQVLFAPFRVGIQLLSGVFTILRAGIKVIMFLLAPIIALFEWLGDEVLDPIIEAVDWIGIKMGVWSAYIDEVMEPLEGIEGLWTDIWDAIKSIWDLLFGSSMLHIKEGVSEVSPSLKILSNLWEALLKPLEMITDMLTKFWDMLGQIPEKLGGLANQVAGTAERAWNKVSELGRKAWDGLKNVAVSVWGTIKDTAKAAWKGIEKFGSAALEKAKSLGRSTVSAISKIWSKTKGLAGSAVSNLKSGASSAAKLASKAWGSFTGLFKKKEPARRARAAADSSIKSDSTIEEASVSKERKVSEIYGVKFTDNMNKQNIQLGGIKGSMDKAVELLSMILLKEDPDNAEAAKHLRDIKTGMDEDRNKVTFITSESGFGERTNQWWTD